MEKDFAIADYPFDERIELKLLDKERDYLTWPVVYFLQNTSTYEAYVGETTDIISRMRAHLRTPGKQNLKHAHLIKSKLFNKSATLDIEANLIRYIAADGTYKLKNGNLGLADHSFYQKKEVYWDLFKDIWNELISQGIARHSLDYIDNSDLFKYSPYKTLSRDQLEGLKMILECLLDETAKVSLIHGGAGTGKSVLAIFLFKLMKTDLSDFNVADFGDQYDLLIDLVTKVRSKYNDLEMGLVIPMQSFRKTISKVFRNINGLSSSMVIGPSEVAKKRYDLLIVDEGHRLRRWKNLGTYFSAFGKAAHQLGFQREKSTELDWVLAQSDKAVIFYDSYQSIKPSDVEKEVFMNLESQPFTRIRYLKSQQRVRGGEYYSEFIYRLFSDNSNLENWRQSTAYDFRLFSDLSNMLSMIREKEDELGLCRTVAGFAWDWISKKDKSRKDIVIDGIQLKWNSTQTDWVNSPNAVNEVGCIHTIQGYDLNYTAVIIGPELDYDFDTNSFIVYEKEYRDKAGKIGIGDPAVLKEYILNIYKTLLLRGIRGTYVYACNSNLRRYLARHLQEVEENSSSRTIKLYDAPAHNRVPFYDLKVAAGAFSGVQQPEINHFIEVEGLKYLSDKYFACKVVGESMNKVIPNGSICLFKKDEGGSRNGLICLVQSQNIFDHDFGANFTVKEYSSKKTISEDGWHHEEIILLPRSTDSRFEPIVLRDEEVVNFKVVGIFERVLG